MNKIDSSIVNNLRIYSSKISSSSNVAELCYNATPLVYNLFASSVKFNPSNSKWLNRDRVIVSNKLLPLYYGILNLCYNEISLDNLKEYGSFTSITSNIAKISTPGIDASSIKNGDVISSAVGIALGERYLESLVKEEEAKNNLVNFYTYCLCTKEDIMDASSYEALSFAKSQDLSKLIIIIFDDISNNDFKDDLNERFSSIGFEFESLKMQEISSFNNAVEDARKAKTISIFQIKYKESAEVEKKISELKEASWEEDNVRSSFEKIVNKRLTNSLNKWDALKEESIKNSKLKEIINFLENKKIKIAFKPENIKINDGYEEELLVSNNKILNIVASKSPFILCTSDIDFAINKNNITKSTLMSKENPLGRNIYFHNRVLSMAGVSCGLAFLGFKVFASTYLVNENLIASSIKLSLINNLNINFTFTHDTFLNSYQYSLHSFDEVSHLYSIPNLINFRPCDINEIIGTYDLLSQFEQTTTLILGNDKTPKINGSQSKYVPAGAYPIKKETEELNAIIIASGSEVSIALKLAFELSYYGILIRVVSMPSESIFTMQTERYKNILLPKDIKTFVIDFNNASFAYKYVSGKDYILDINKYTFGGSKEELLNEYNLNTDALKARIIELMKK